MEYLWVAGVTAMLADKWIWEIVMYLFLFYACCKMPFPAFAGVKRWILAALGVHAAGFFAPEIFWVQWGLTALHSVLYFWIWYQSFQGIRQMESIYGDLNGRGIISAYWVELILTAVGIYVMGMPITPWLDRMIRPAIILVQVWKAHLLYCGHRDYEIRRRQLAELEKEG